MTGVQRNSDCRNKSHVSKMKPQGNEWMFRKNIQNVRTRIKFINSLVKQHQCWKRHHFADVPSESVFQGPLKVTYLHLQPPQRWVFHMSWILRLQPQRLTFCPPLQLQLQTPASYSYFVFLYLIITVTVFQQQPRISATLLSCCFKITVTRQRSVSVHTIFFLTEC